MDDGLVRELSNLSLAPSSYTYSSLNTLNLGEVYSDEVFEIGISTMIINLKKLLSYCLDNMYDVKFPSRVKDKGVHFVMETRRFTYVKSYFSTLEVESVYSVISILHILIRTLQAMSAEHLVLPRSIRDIYYEFKNENGDNYPISMSTITARIDDLTNLFSCSRSSLGVTSESGNSGFIGNIVVVRKRRNSCEEVLEDASLLDQVHTINFSNIVKVQSTKVAPVCILIVEKLSIFRNLVATLFHRSLPCIIVTGGGEPSIECRLFVRLLHDTFRVSAFYVGDCNPYGFEIFRTYKYGSINLAHMSKNLVIPSLRFLGLLHEDIPKGLTELMAMTDRDIAKAEDLLQQEWVGLEPDIKDSLLFNIEKKRKADVELMISRGDLTYVTGVFLPRILRCFVDRQQLL